MACNVGFYVFAVRWVKPNYVALPVLSGWCVVVSGW